VRRRRTRAGKHTRERGSGMQPGMLFSPHGAPPRDKRVPGLAASGLPARNQGTLIGASLARRPLVVKVDGARVTSELPNGGPSLLPRLRGRRSPASAYADDEVALRRTQGGLGTVT